MPDRRINADEDKTANFRRSAGLSIRAFVLIAKPQRDQSGDLFEDACKIALVVAAHLVTDPRAVGIRCQQHPLGRVDADVCQVVHDGNTHLLSKQMRHARDTQLNCQIVPTCLP